MSKLNEKYDKNEQIINEKHGKLTHSNEEWLSTDDRWWERIFIEHAQRTITDRSYLTNKIRLIKQKFRKRYIQKIKSNLPALLKFPVSCKCNICCKLLLFPVAYSNGYCCFCCFFDHNKKYKVVDWVKRDKLIKQIIHTNTDNKNTIKIYQNREAVILDRVLYLYLPSGVSYFIRVLSNLNIMCIELLSRIGSDFKRYCENDGINEDELKNKINVDNFTITTIDSYFDKVQQFRDKYQKPNILIDYYYIQHNKTNKLLLFFELRIV